MLCLFHKPSCCMTAQQQLEHWNFPQLCWAFLVESMWFLEVMPQVFKCSVREMKWCLISQTEHLNTSGITCNGTDSIRVKPITPGHPIPKISTRLTIFWGGTWKTELVKTTTDKIGHHQKKNQMDSTRNAQ